MRPKPLEGVPDPSLRRYLNPLSGSSRAQMLIQPPPESQDFSPADLSSMHLQEALSMTHPSQPDDTSPTIEMQTYARRSSKNNTTSDRSSRRRSASGNAAAGTNVDANSEFGKVLAVTAVRQREPRENSDFLRVIVLEMNMQRLGKLDGKAGGRARVWLPPRKMGGGGGSLESSGGRARGGGGGSGVPRRWIGEVAG